MNTLSAREWSVLVTFAILAPFVHFYVQVYWAVIAMPLLPPSQSGALQMLWLFAVDLVGASIAALVLAGPLAYFVRGRPLLVAALLSGVTALAALVMWRGNLLDRAALLTYVELATFFALCWVVARAIGWRLSHVAHAT